MMTRLYRCFATTAELKTAVIFSSVLLACSGCEGGPGMPLGFGPPLDNLFALLLLLLVGAFAYKLLSPVHKGSAEGIARERYARGEITEAEYSQIMRTLSARLVIR